MVKLQPEEKLDTVYLSHGPGDGRIRHIDGVIQSMHILWQEKMMMSLLTYKDSKGFLTKAVIRREVWVDGGIGDVIHNKKRII